MSKTKLQKTIIITISSSLIIVADAKIKLIKLLLNFFHSFLSILKVIHPYSGKLKYIKANFGNKAFQTHQGNFRFFISSKNLRCQVLYWSLRNSPTAHLKWLLKLLSRDGAANPPGFLIVVMPTCGAPAIFFWEWKD